MVVFGGEGEEDDAAGCRPSFGGGGGIGYPQVYYIIELFKEIKYLVSNYAYKSKNGSVIQVVVTGDVASKPHDNYLRQ